MNITSRITSATFSACITRKEELPKDDLPVIALVGRSNVGKSSLINSLTGRKELARTSSMPGKTLTMNFYCINDAFYLVDLPGYGYAKASKSTRNKIQIMMDEFFMNCSNLKGVVQIIDIRHKPTTLDIQMHTWLKEQRFNGFVVLTKTDKLSNQQCIKMRQLILKDIKDTYTMTYSSKTYLGRDEFLDAIEKILAGYEFKIVDSRPKTNVDVEEETEKRVIEDSSSKNKNGKISNQNLDEMVRSKNLNSKVNKDIRANRKDGNDNRKLSSRNMKRGLNRSSNNKIKRE